MAAVFAALGTAWVLLTDTLLYALTTDQVLIARFETAKGWLFVGVTTLILYAVTRVSATGLTRARATFAAVVDSIADGVLLLGPDRIIAYANPAALEMLRCEPRELIGMGAQEFSRRFRVSYPDGALVPPDEFVSQRVFTEGGPLTYKASLHPPGGRELVILATAAAVRERAGDPAELVVSVMHDITATEHLERHRNRLFMAAAHSFKTPIAVIKTCAQLLGRGKGDAPALIASIERQCGRIDRLVQNVLVFARARTATLQLHPHEVRLESLVEAIASEMSVASTEHRVRTQVAASPRIYADSERLAMVVRNLVDQALRLSTSGAPLTLRLRQRAQDAEIGVGYQPLAPEAQAFKGLEDEGEEELDGLGISRWVDTMIVKAHGGTLWEETAGEERISWVRLPAIEGASAHA
ncbi:MAG TPA: PAS domain-containing sensor histidine kinase [Myxococcaceae bacterium]